MNRAAEERSSVAPYRCRHRFFVVLHRKESHRLCRWFETSFWHPPSDRCRFDPDGNEERVVDRLSWLEMRRKEEHEKWLSSVTTLSICGGALNGEDLVEIRGLEMSLTFLGKTTLHRHSSFTGRLNKETNWRMNCASIDDAYVYMSVYRCIYALFLFSSRGLWQLYILVVEPIDAGILPSIRVQWADTIGRWNRPIRTMCLLCVLYRASRNITASPRANVWRKVINHLANGSVAETIHVCSIQPHAFVQPNLCYECQFADIPLLSTSSNCGTTGRNQT